MERQQISSLLSLHLVSCVSWLVSLSFFLVRSSYVCEGNYTVPVFLCVRASVEFVLCIESPWLPCSAHITGVSKYHNHWGILQNYSSASWLICRPIAGHQFRVFSTLLSLLQAYEKKTDPRWRYDLGRMRNFEQVSWCFLPFCWLFIHHLEILAFSCQSIMFICLILDQVFGTDKRYWLIPRYSADDLKHMPALKGLDYPTRSNLDELQQLWYKNLLLSWRKP